MLYRNKGDKDREVSLPQRELQRDMIETRTGTKYQEITQQKNSGL